MMKSYNKYQYPDHSKFQKYRLLAFGYDRKKCANFLFVTERTIRNWEANRQTIPYAAFRLLKLKAEGRILCDEWEGWTSQGQSLFSPIGREYKSTELSYLDLFLTAARGYLYKAKNKRHYDEVENHGRALDEVNSLFRRLKQNLQSVYAQKTR